MQLTITLKFNYKFMLFVLVCFSLNNKQILGQCILTKECQQPVSGDILKGQCIDDILTFGEGTKCIWDLSHSNLLNNEIEITIWEKDTLGNLPILVNGSLFYTDSRHSSLSINRLTNKLQDISFDSAEIIMKYPLTLGDSILGEISGKGMYCDKLEMKVLGTYILCADKTGSLILPNGEILKNVLQVHTRKFLSRNLFPSDFKHILNKKDSVTQKNSHDSLLFFQDRILLFAKGYRYPIISKTICSQANTRNTTNTEIIFFNPDEQNLLQIDEKNRTIRKIDNTMMHSNEEHSNSLHKTIDYKLLIDRINNKITLKYALSENAYVEGILSDSKGITLKKTTQYGKKGKDNVMEFNYFKNPISNTFILYIKVKGRIFTEKFNS